MIQKEMRASMAVTLAVLFVMLAFGRSRLAPFYDSVGTGPPSAADVTETIHTLFWPDHDEAAAEGGEAQGRLSHEIPRVVASSTTGAAASEAVSPDNAADERSSTAAVPLPERETPTEEAPPDPQAVRDSASAEVEALGPLYDELIEALEAIHEALTDREEKRQARQRVTMAGLAKRQQIRDLRLYIAPKQPEWSVQSARRTAAKARVSLDYDIAVARESLAKLRRR